LRCRKEIDETMDVRVNREIVNDAMKLMMHRLIARELGRAPLLDRARISQAKMAERFADRSFVREWDELLSAPAAELRARLTSRDSDMVRLRSSPSFVLAEVSISQTTIFACASSVQPDGGERGLARRSRKADDNGHVMSDDSTLRTEEDLQRAVRALAREFKTDTVFIIGSQAILMSWPEAPAVMRGSPEIDAYPANAKMWELAEASKGDGPPLEASEHINGLFGLSSQFHHTHRFYIDGTDENTAKPPKGWNTRAIVRHLDVDGRMVKAVAPALQGDEVRLTAFLA
jgi:hypothetical protein